MIVKLAAVAIPASLFVLATAEAPSPQKTPTAWTQDFSFERHTLAAVGGASKSIRTVHPDLAHIAGWISSVGAAVAAFDYDGDGLSNDYCLVDPRFDSVTIAPVPTTGRRYASIELGWDEGTATPGSVAPMGCLPADLDQDGAEDIVLYYWGRGPTIHLAAAGYRARSLLEHPEIWHSNAALVGDFNGDGHADLLVGNYFPGDFEVLGTQGRAHMQRSMSRARNAGQNRLFIGDGQGGFTDSTSALADAAPRGWTLSLGAADLDGDMLPEIYVGNDFGPDHLLHNVSTDGEVRFSRVTARRGFTDARSRVLGRDSFKGMGTDFGDIDRDGVLDIYVSNIAEPYALMESHLLFRGTGDISAFPVGRAPFEEVSGETGVARSAWSWDARFVDFNGDGWSEILQATGFVRGETDRWPELHEVAMGNDELLQFPGSWPVFGAGDDLSGDRHDALFVRKPDGKWTEAAAAVGLEAASVSRGIAIADVDGDGDADALIARQWEPSIVMINTSSGAERTATLVPRIVTIDGREFAARGAQVVVYAAGGQGPRIADTVPGGEGHSGKSAPEVHVGLGAFDDSVEVLVEITWRDTSGMHTRTVPIRSGRQVIELSPQLSVLTPGRARGVGSSG